MSTATASTTIVRPIDSSFRDALGLALIFAAIGLLFQIATNLWEAHIGYGYFRDELYYLMCGRHLAWGYVDHGPIVAVTARLSETSSDISRRNSHVVRRRRRPSRPADRPARMVHGRAPFRTGSRHAGSLACASLLCFGQLFSMNSFESIFWMTCLLALILMLRGYSERWSWIAFGIAGASVCSTSPP